MNTWEKNLLAFLLSATENLVPIFVHSKNGVAVVNASEPLVTSLVQSLAAPAAPAAPPVTSISGA
jgi:hypothetical protein